MIQNKGAIRFVHLIVLPLGLLDEEGHQLDHYVVRLVLEHPLVLLEAVAQLLAPEHEAELAGDAGYDAGSQAGLVVDDDAGKCKQSCC